MNDAGEVPAPDDLGERSARRVSFRGVVQGVGFRPFIHRLASDLGLHGSVQNDEHGVTAIAVGTREQLDEFVRRARVEAPPAARIEALEVRDVAAAELPQGEPAEFHIEASPVAAEARRSSIPPDLATCPACLAELRDPADRRYRYPFTNCTHCGPRFTIAREIPYDRCRTTMRDFRMCPACEREYRDVRDRRFHAQPNACPSCGPQLAFLDGGGEEIATRDEALRAAADAIVRGAIVAVKGLGGYHLACDATSSHAVARLRARKHREAKPLGVMVADLAAAERLADISPSERSLLTSVERPIVLLRALVESGLAPEVAPESPSIGVMLAYTPLHHLLCEAVARPMVMTSGNASDEPIAFRDPDALARLRGIADFFLVHDREIEARADDSVARVIAGAPVLLRRSRGYVPRGIALKNPVAQPVLAVGGHLKNTFCLAAGDVATLGPHVGDLETLEAAESLGEQVARMERFLALRPSVIAHDLHPDYASTHYALERAVRSGARLVGVQHHHAHVAAVMAEHGVVGPAIGFAWDGTGYGPDGEAWGGELLLTTYRGYRRLATFRPIPLAGGERAIREPWRVALALVEDAFAGLTSPRPPAVIEARRPSDVRIVRRMIESHVNAPMAHGVGRYFDGVAALVLGRAAARFEGQLPMALEWAADEAEIARYPFALDREPAAPWRPTEIDLRPTVRAIVADLDEGVSAGLVAARFHETLAEVVRSLALEATRDHGRLPIVLSGGCFQNARLVEACLRRLQDEPVKVLRAADVPPGDGGLALGQAVVADALVRRDAARRAAERNTGGQRACV